MDAATRDAASGVSRGTDLAVNHTTAAEGQHYREPTEDHSTVAAKGGHASANNVVAKCEPSICHPTPSVSPVKQSTLALLVPQPVPLPASREQGPTGSAACNATSAGTGMPQGDEDAKMIRLGSQQLKQLSLDQVPWTGHSLGNLRMAGSFGGSMGSVLDTPEHSLKLPATLHLHSDSNQTSPISGSGLPSTKSDQHCHKGLPVSHLLAGFEKQPAKGLPEVPLERGSPMHGRSTPHGATPLSSAVVANSYGAAASGNGVIALHSGNVPEYRRTSTSSSDEAACFQLYGRPAAPAVPFTQQAQAAAAANPFQLAARGPESGTRGPTPASTADAARAQHGSLPTLSSADSLAIPPLPWTPSLQLTWAPIAAGSSLPSLPSLPLQQWCNEGSLAATQKVAEGRQADTSATRPPHGAKQALGGSGSLQLQGSLMLDPVSGSGIWSRGLSGLFMADSTQFKSLWQDFEKAFAPKCDGGTHGKPADSAGNAAAVISAPPPATSAAQAGRPHRSPPPSLPPHSPLSQGWTCYLSHPLQDACAPGHPPHQLPQGSGHVYGEQPDLLHNYQPLLHHLQQSWHGYNTPPPQHCNTPHSGACHCHCCAGGHQQPYPAQHSLSPCYHHHHAPYPLPPSQLPAPPACACCYPPGTPTPAPAAQHTLPPPPPQQQQPSRPRRTRTVRSAAAVCSDGEANSWGLNANHMAATDDTGGGEGGDEGGARGEERDGGEMGRKRKRDVGHITVDFLERGKYFDMPIQVAAAELQVGVTTLKKACRMQGITRWPFRKRSSLDNLIEKTQQFIQGDDADSAQQKQLALQALMKQRIQLMEDAGTNIDPDIKRYRQSIFKINYKLKQREREANSHDPS